VPLFGQPTLAEVEQPPQYPLFCQVDGSIQIFAFLAHIQVVTVAGQLDHHMAAVAGIPLPYPELYLHPVELMAIDVSRYGAQ